MDPVTKGEPIEKEVNREGIDIFFALDISKSMLTEDVKPNRIKKSKQILSEVISSLKGDKVGVIVYAAGATVVSPLTLDYAWVKNQIKDVLVRQRRNTWLHYKTGNVINVTIN